MMVSKRNFLFWGLLFRFHVKFRVCNQLRNDIDVGDALNALKIAHDKRPLQSSSAVCKTCWLFVIIIISYFDLLKVLATSFHGRSSLNHQFGIICFTFPFASFKQTSESKSEVRSFKFLLSCCRPTWRWRTLGQYQNIYKKKMYLAWNEHSTWKYPPGKGDSYWKPSCLGAMLVSGRVLLLMAEIRLTTWHVAKTL